jgi:hypothetical protein
MSEVAAGEAGSAGWVLVQLSESVRRAKELLDGTTLVGPHAHAEMAPDDTIELGAAEVRRIARALAEGVEIAEQLELLAARLPAHAVAAGWEAVRDAAAADLAEGIVDPSRVVLAARVLDVGHGWPALAASLAEGDAVSAWSGLTVDELLGRFRAADPRTVARVLADAGLERGTPFATCPSEQLTALAVGLRRHASGQPTP